jgi:bifunctional non-homologous end joining protein LigD
MPLELYRKKRNFQRTREPAGAKTAAAKGRAPRRQLAFVVQKHHATRLHYDFRLELDGVLKSWAVPKGPSLDPAEKRLAVHVEDHPIEYGSFEGEIPKGEYGAGRVEIWDRGTWVAEGDPRAAYREGKLKFRLEGHKLHGGWALVRMRGREGETKENWLLIKERDEEARTGKKAEIVDTNPAPVSARKKTGPHRIWHSNRKAAPRKKSAAAQRVRRAAVRGAPSFPDLSSEISGMRRGSLPQFVAPELPTLVDEPPPGTDWVHEIKLDGYRALCRVDRGNARFLTRHAKDWTDRFGSLAAAAKELPVDQALLDGEIVALDEKGVSSFQTLQNALGGGSDVELVYFAFDLLHLNGNDLRLVPLEERKEILSRVLLSAGSPSENPGSYTSPVRYSAHVEGKAEDVYREACKLSLEGIVCKRRKGIYQSGRSRDWVKVKCLSRQEFVIVGYTDPQGARPGFGALLLAVNDARGLVYTGRVGTGFTQASLRDVLARLRAIERAKPALVNAPTGASARGVHWVEPRLVAEVAFTGWTNDGALRHPTFQGLREDKNATEIVREEPRPAVATATGARRDGAQRGSTKRGSASRSSTSRTSPSRGSANRRGAPARRARSSRATSATSAAKDEAVIAGVRLTNPGRVLYREQDITKRDLAEFYESIADRILPHVIDRPLSIVRCPDGQDAACFYQKHTGAGTPSAIREVAIKEEAGEAPYMYIADLAGLIALVQIGALEIHPWGSRVKRVDSPDLMTIDLDPGPGVAWSAVTETARRLRARLASLSLESFCKTTGGKGLHVVTPLAPRHTWEEVRSFSKALATELVRESPDRFTTTMAKSARQGKIFVDALRNSRGATAVAPYSTRAKPQAPIATPVAWDEVGAKLAPDRYTIRNLPRRLATLRKDPWAGFGNLSQRITKAMRKDVGL